MPLRQLMLAARAFAVMCIALLTGTVSAQSIAPQECEINDCLQVGSWNIEWLGTKMRGRAGDSWPTRSKHAVGQLSRLVSRIDLEIVVFQDIDPTSIQYGWFRDAMQTNGYSLLPSMQGSQSLVIAWQQGEAALIHGSFGMLALPERISIEKEQDSGQCDGRVQRPIKADFRSGNFEFRVIGVSLEVRTDGNCEGELRSRLQQLLLAEIDLMLAAQPALDLILLGDFGEDPGDSIYTGLATLPTGVKLVSLTSSNLRDNRSADFSYPFGEPAAASDHILVIEANSDAAVALSGYYMHLPADQLQREKYRQFLSDHVPIWASFRTDR